MQFITGRSKAMCLPLYMTVQNRQALTPFRSQTEEGNLPLDKDSKKEIDQHDSVALALMLCPFIHPQHFDSTRRGKSSMTHQSQDGIGTTRHTQSLARLGSRFATNDLTKRTQALSQARCVLSVRQQEVRQSSY